MNEIIVWISIILLILSSYYILKYSFIKYIIGIVFLISFFYILKKKSFNDIFDLKTSVVFFGFFLVIWGINNNNKIINKYIVPFVLFLNILFLITMCYPFKTIQNYISLLGFIYLLITFDYTKWNVENMKLINVDYNWIIAKTIILSYMYIFDDCVKEKIKALIVLYTPLIFPLNEYLIHRTIHISFGFLYHFISN